MPSNLRSNTQSGAGEALLRERRRHRLEPVGHLRGECHGDRDQLKLMIERRGERGAAIRGTS